MQSREINLIGNFDNSVSNEYGFYNPKSEKAIIARDVVLSKDILFPSWILDVDWWWKCLSKSVYSLNVENVNSETDRVE